MPLRQYLEMSRLTPRSDDDDVPMSANLLTKFFHDCVALYGKGFISYNVHSLIHLVKDFQYYEPLDFV